MKPAKVQKETVKEVPAYGDQITVDINGSRVRQKSFLCNECFHVVSKGKATECLNGWWQFEHDKAACRRQKSKDRRYDLQLWRKYQKKGEYPSLLNESVVGFGEDIRSIAARMRQFCLVEYKTHARRKDGVCRRCLDGATPKEKQVNGKFIRYGNSI